MVYVLNINVNNVFKVLRFLPQVNWKEELMLILMTKSNVDDFQTVFSFE